MEQQLKGSIASGALAVEAASGSFMISQNESDAPWQSKKSKALSSRVRACCKILVYADDIRLCFIIHCYRDSLRAHPP